MITGETKDMIVDFISDIHINHHVPFTHNQLKWETRTKEWVSKMCESQQGKVLIIAGDFSEFNQQSMWVLEECKNHYKYVLFVIGNHDYYLLSKTQRKKYGDSIGRINDFLERASQLEGVYPLHGDMVEVEGKRIAGESLWYFPNNYKDLQFYREQSNDSKFIHILREHDYAVDYQEVSFYYLHHQSMKWYESLTDQDIDLMVTHVPPVYFSNGKYPVNSCYYTSVPFLASKHWICGHQHEVTTFQKAGTTFYMNAVGYPRESKKIIPKVQSVVI